MCSLGKAANYGLKLCQSKEYSSYVQPLSNKHCSHTVGIIIETNLTVLKHCAQIVVLSMETWHNCSEVLRTPLKELIMRLQNGLTGNTPFLCFQSVYIGLYYRILFNFIHFFRQNLNIGCSKHLFMFIYMYKWERRKFG